MPLILLSRMFRVSILWKSMDYCANFILNTPSPGLWVGKVCMDDGVVRAPFHLHLPPTLRIVTVWLHRTKLVTFHGVWKPMVWFLIREGWLINFLPLERGRGQGLLERRGHIWEEGLNTGFTVLGRVCALSIRHTCLTHIHFLSRLSSYFRTS